MASLLALETQRWAVLRKLVAKMVLQGKVRREPLHLRLCGCSWSMLNLDVN